MERPDRQVERIARNQKGLVTRQQCREAGLTDTEIHYRLKSFGWQRHLPSVFQLPGTSSTPETRLMGAQLWAGDRGLLCRSSSAWILKMDDQTPSIPEVYLRSGQKVSSVRTYRLACTDQPHVSRVRGFRVTCAERTLLDLSAVWPAIRVGRAMDAALRNGQTSLERCAQAAEGWGGKGKAGTVVFRELLRGRDHRDVSVRSEFETKMLRILKRIETSPVVPDHPVSDGPANRYLDFAFPELRLAVECQSIKWHLGSEAWRADMARHRRLMALGWTVLFYCWDDVLLEPQRVQSEVEAALRNRRNRLF